MAKSEKTPNVSTDHGIVGLEYSAQKFHDADGNRLKDSDGNKQHGAQHWYAKDAAGKKTHISEVAMLDKFGYGPDDYQGSEPPEAIASVDDGEAEPPIAVLGDIGSVDTGRSPIPSVEDDDDDLNLDLDDDDLDDDPDADTDADEVERLENERQEALIAVLQEDMELMTLAAVAFEKSGDLIHRDKAFYKFAHLLDTLAELKGWDTVRRNEYWVTWTNLVAYMLGDSADPTDPTDPIDPSDPVVDEEAMRASVARSEALTELSSRLKVSRDKLAKLNVEASGRIRLGGKLKDELEAARLEWQNLQVEVGSKTMEHILLEDEGVTEEMMRGFAAQGAKNEATALSQAQLDASISGPDGGRVKRFMHKYADSYNKAGRIKKALMLAPGGILVGVGVGTIIGAVGGGIIAGLVARGAVKGALTSKMQALRGREGQQVDISNFDISLSDEDAARVPHLLALRAAGLNRSATETDVSKNTRQNKKRAGIAVGVGSIVGIASGVAANILTDQHWGRGSGVGGKVTKIDPFDGQRPGLGGVIDNPPGGASEILPGGSGINPIEYAGSQGVDIGARDAWPFKIANQLGLSEQESISLAQKSGFSFRDGKYWMGSRMMNYDEMVMHNLSLADIAAKRAAGV